jgi:hypothetical protein
MKVQTRNRPTKSRPKSPATIRLTSASALSDKNPLHALLYEALETEQNGVLVYQTALKCVINDDLEEEWTRYLEQTRRHVTVLTAVLKKLGMNPDQDTPGRNVVRHSGMGLCRTMEIALTAVKPAQAEIVAAECVVLAETKDHMNWQLIGVAAETLSGAERDTLKKAYGEVEDEEDEHLYHSAGWARELHLQALGLPAQLPPVEEEDDVTSEIDAARVRRQRKATLMKNAKGASSEETNREKGAGVQRSIANRAKRQTRRSAA